MMMMIILLLLVYLFSGCNVDCLFPPECSYFSPPATVILLILLCFEGLLFLIFTAVMFGTQVHSICSDETVSKRQPKAFASDADGEPEE